MPTTRRRLLLGRKAPAIYYFDPTLGLDTNPGTKSAPFQTTAKVTALKNPGESALFKCGEIFKAQGVTVPISGTKGQPITFGKYGTGANPIFDGSSRFTDFALDSGAIYKRTVSDANVFQVFEDGVRLRYQVNKAAMVAAGCFAVEVATLYVWASDSGNPNTHVTEYTLNTPARLFRMNGKSNLVFDGLDVKQVSSAYMCDLVGSHDILIKNATTSYCGRAFLIGTDGTAFCTYPTDVTIQNCVGHDDTDVPFWIGHGTRLVLDGCTSYNNGVDVFPGAKNYPAATHFPDGICVSAEAIDCIVRNCYIHDIWYGSVCMDEYSAVGACGSTRTIWERNKIDATNAGVGNYALMMDGANTIVRNNIILHSAQLGITSGTTGPATPLIYHNTIINTGADGATSLYFLNKGTAFQIKNNIFVRNGTTNRFISLILAAGYAGISLDNNEYYQISGTPRWKWSATEYTSLATWKAAVTPNDANSLSSDPVFVTNYTDLHLQTTSPCKNTGATGLDVLVDYDGKTRDATPDIGAYEFFA